MIKPKVLIIAEKKDIWLREYVAQNYQWDLQWYFVNYNKLGNKTAELKEIISKWKIDFVAYSRNDQIYKRINIGNITAELEVGYTSFSGIDNKYRMEQTLGCVCDFLKGQNELDFHVQEKTVEKADHGHLGTFSIIFDTEQISCCKYALARILNLLNTYGVPATFFVTNLMNDVYSNLIEIIIGQGHEIGLHGHWHEYLSNHPKKDQVESIQGMIRNFNADIHGANFIGRMDTNTISAMIANKLNYFVYASVNNYRLFAYRKQSNVPSLIHQPEGEIWAIPISVETYGLPWASVKRMVDSTLAKGTKSHFHHITILCHPFRDGNFRNIHATDKLFDYLLEKGLKPITIDQLTHSLSHDPVNYFEPNNINEIFRTKKPNIPRMSTTQDFFGFVPENAILIFKIFRRGHSVF